MSRAEPVSFSRRRDAWSGRVGLLVVAIGLAGAALQPGTSVSLGMTSGSTSLEVASGGHPHQHGSN